MNLNKIKLTAGEVEGKNCMENKQFCINHFNSQNMHDTDVNRKIGT